MKYAFIALIAIYLVVYGCSPDSAEKATDSHDKTAPVTLEKPHEAEIVAAPAHDEHQFPAENLDMAVVVEEPAVVTELTEQPAEATQPVVEEQQEPPVVEQRVIVETQPASKEEQPAEDADSEMVVMPCGKTMARADIPENAPCLQQQETQQETAATEPDLEAAILKLAEKTHEMIQATNQLIDATNKAISTVEAQKK